MPPLTVERFGPESHDFEAKTLDFHVDGDVGIGDLVFASTYWSLPTRQQNEYSQYIQNFNGGANEGVTCLNDPVYGTGPYTGCNVPIQYYEYHTNPERWSDELRLVSKPGGRFHWLTGLYWEKTRDKNSGSTYYMPGLRTNSPAFEYYNAYAVTPPGSTSLPATEWYAYMTRSDYLQTTEFANINFDITNKLNVEAGVVHFHSDFKYYSPFGQFAYQPVSPTLDQGSSHKPTTPSVTGTGCAGSTSASTGPCRGTRPRRHPARSAHDHATRPRPARGPPAPATGTGAPRHTAARPARPRSQPGLGGTAQTL